MLKKGRGARDKENKVLETKKKKKKTKKEGRRRKRKEEEKKESCSFVVIFYVKTVDEWLMFFSLWLRFTR